MGGDCQKVTKELLSKVAFGMAAPALACQLANVHASLGGSLRVAFALCIKMFSLGFVSEFHSFDVSIHWGLVEQQAR